MAFFIPYSIQKRLLRYVLSNLELIDTDTLDLDRLDVEWGRRSTVELRDIALRKDKLASLLQLPPDFRVINASVACLRVTIPSDLYTSSIEIEALGAALDVTLVEASSDQRAQQNDRQESTSTGTRSHASRSRSKSATALPKNPTKLSEETLPTPQDLAESFLDQEPVEEKEYLEAELNTRSNILQQSVTTSEADSESQGYGNEPGFGLPSFVAGFIAGVGERLTLTVRDLRLEVHFHLDIPNAAHKHDNNGNAVPLSILVLVETLCLGSADVKRAPLESAVPNDASEHRKVALARTVVVSALRSALVSESAVFEEWTTSLGSANAGPAEASPTSSWPHGHQPAQKSPLDPQHQAFYLTSMLLDTFVGSSARHTSNSLHSASKASDPVVESTSRSAGAPQAYPQHVGGQLSSAGGLSEVEKKDSVGIHRYLDDLAAAEVHSPGTSAGYSFGNGSNSHDLTSRSCDRRRDLDSQPGHDSDVEDLTESHLFSHAEAQSLYMSAVDDPPSQYGSLRRARVPGAWDSSVGDIGDTGKVKTKVKQKIKSSTTYQSPSRTITSRKMPTQELPISLGQEITEEQQLHPDKSVLPSPESTSRRTIESRKILSVDVIKFQFSANNAPAETLSASRNRETSHVNNEHPIWEPRVGGRAVPGAFTTNSSHLSSTQGKGQTTSHNQEEKALKMDIGSISGDSDVKVCAILSHAARKILDSYNAIRTSVPDTGAISHSDVQAVKSTIELHVSSLDISFANSMIGDSDSDRDTEPELSPDVGDLREVLVGVNVKDIGVRLKRSEGVNSCEVEIGDLSLSSNDRFQLNCSSQGKAKSSASGTKPAQTKAISILYDFRKPDVTVSTSPVVIHANIQKVDESTGSFVGLSALLEAGSSTLSEKIRRSHIERNHRSQTPVRAVRFDIMDSKSTSMSDEDESLKINIRVGGIVMHINSKTCDLGLTTSAVKIISRTKILGAQIDEIRLEGPLGPGFDDDLASAIILRNTGLRYLEVPEELDLSRLISLLTPSSDKFAEEDDILVDTLIRQRRRGAVARVSISHASVELKDVTSLRTFENLRSDISRLTTITKYLPQDSRPGLLSLVSLRDFKVRMQNLPGVGSLSFELTGTEIAHVGNPSLLALGIRQVAVKRNQSGALIHPVTQCNMRSASLMIMARFIGDDIDPTLKVKLFNVCLEYDANLVTEAMSVLEKTELTDLSQSLRESVQMLLESRSAGSNDNDPQAVHTNSRLDVQMRDCGIGLTPRAHPAKALVVLTKARLRSSTSVRPGETLRFSFDKGVICLINDAALLETTHADEMLQLEDQNDFNGQVTELCRAGYVCVTWITAAEMNVISTATVQDVPTSLNVTIQDALIVLETCADSTQTLFELFSSLNPPMPTSKLKKYQTETAPLGDIMASFTGDAFASDLPATKTRLGESPFEEDLQAAFEDIEATSDDASDHSVESLGDASFVTSPLKKVRHAVQDRSEQSSRPPPTAGLSSGVRAKPMSRKAQAVALKWDSTRNQYDSVSVSEAASAPYAFALRNLHLIWNLHDGYDWKDTREAIQKVVRDVEEKSEAKRHRRRNSGADNDDDESVIGDFLFNSIYIGIPSSQEPRDLTRHINEELADHVSETTSLTSAHTRPTSHGARHTRAPKRKLRLERSARHKLTIELRGIDCDTYVFCPGAETASSTDVRVHNLEIFDHVPTSTWKKFASYLVDIGPREDRKPMVHLELCDVKPVPTLAASELVIRATILPLRLHVDQDTLDFITRFFEFDDKRPTQVTPTPSQTYIQRIEVRPVSIKLDYKPKKVDYSGLRSGRTKEFMNFFNLDGADMVLKHAILYGCPSFSKLHQSLEDIWMPDIKRHQLPGILSGLNGVRTLVNVSNGVRNLVVVPVHEYQKDGRLVRSVAKGASLFARTTSSEITKFGARLAIGAQNALQGVEGLLTVRDDQSNEWEALDLGDADAPRALSNYADQPLGILQGLRGAIKSLERDLLVTKDVIIAVSTEARESGSLEGAAKAVARNAPTLILRPMIGASKAVSQTLLGAANSADPQNRRRLEDKYKQY